MKFSEKQLLRLSLIISILGIFLLLTILRISKPLEKRINDISFKDLHKFVRIKGEVSVIRESRAVTILRINQGNSSIYGLIKGRISLQSNSNCIVDGRVVFYKGKLYIDIYEIKDC